jgi:hypothetical protein
MFSTTCENEAGNRGTVLEFIIERLYLKNVTPKTLSWYADAFKAFDGSLESEGAIKRRIVELRTRGVSAISVNSWLRRINAFLKMESRRVQDTEAEGGAEDRHSDTGPNQTAVQLPAQGSERDPHSHCCPAHLGRWISNQ